MNKRKRSILFAGGGTGGHLFPGIALARELLVRDGNAEIIFATGRKQLEAAILDKYSFAVKKIAVGKWSRGPVKYPLMAVSVCVSWIRSCLFILRKRIRTVVGLGGYSSFGPLLAAYVLHRNIYLLEQNSIPGRTNRFLSRFADAVFTQFESSEIYFRHTDVRQYGNPVRRELRDLERDPEERFTLLITGGSQGALALNTMVIDALERIRFPENSRVIHVCGPDHYKYCSELYADIRVDADIELIGFQDDMAELYRKAAVCVCRAGATSIAEMSCAGIPMIMIPFPFATDDHQFLNAR